MIGSAVQTVAWSVSGTAVGVGDGAGVGVAEGWAWVLVDEGAAVGKTTGSVGAEGVWQEVSARIRQTRREAFIGERTAILHQNEC